MSDKAFYSILSADGTVSGLVGTRIFPVQAPKNSTLPYITYTVDLEDEVHTYQGATGLVRESVEVFCVASTYSGARTLADAVVSAANGFSGTSGGQVMRSVARRGGTPSVEFLPTGAEKPLYLVSIDFETWRQE